jgi:hypothetical protein
VAVASVLVVLAFGGGQAAAAPRLLETLTVPGLTPPGGVTTKTVLKKGASYRLEVSGTITSTFTPPGGVTVGEREDAFYCFEELNEAAVSPTSSCTKNIRYLGVLRTLIGGASNVVETALGIQGRIPYQRSHDYVLDFRAPRSGALTFYSTKLAALSPQGAFQLKLYGNAGKKKKGKRKRIGGCPAARASSPQAHAARSCHWEVVYEIDQKGLPSKSFPNPAAGFVESETAAIGKIFFNAKPKPGRTSTGKVAGLLTHTDTYRSPIHPFLFPEGELRMTPLTARYTPGRGEIRLDVSGVVTSVTGQVYGQDPEGHSTQAGDGARFWATHDFPLHRDDYLQMRFGCSACPKSAAGTGGVHIHDFLVETQDKLRVKIGAPRQLAGGCRCLGTTSP